MLALWAVAAAPPALAATMAGALDWTGITDSHGVPLGAYYLSVVGTGEAITEAGPGLSADPSTWVQLADTCGHQRGRPPNGGQLRCRPRPRCTS